MKKKSSIVYRLYDPKIGKYVSNINPGSFFYDRCKIVFSNVTRSLILRETDLSKFYKKVLEIKNRLKDLEKRANAEPDPRDYRYGRFDLEDIIVEIRNIKNILNVIDRLKLERYELVKKNDKNKIQEFKNLSIKKLSKSTVKQRLQSKYPYPIVEWFIRSLSSNAKLPYAIVEFNYKIWNKDEDSRITIRKQLKNIGVKHKFFNRYSSVATIPDQQNLHLLFLSIAKEEILRGILVEDIIKVYESATNEIQEIGENLW